MNPNDKAMLEKVKPGWWVRCGDLNVWWLVVCLTKESCFVAIDTRQPGIMARDAITAIHAPTDNPSIETAYLLGEPEEV